MQVTSAKFKVSNTDVAKCPADEMHEYAFIGRSNVGKSSLINMLTGKRKLAMTSATPGKTTLINHFIINDSWYIVDLPGYGYAQRSKSEREKLERIISSYILGRPQMTSLFVLVDSRHKPQKIDMEFMEWLGENGVPFAIVFTKLDKLSRTAGVANIEAYKKELLEHWEELPPIFVTSSETGQGRQELLDYIEELNQLPVQTEFS
ncbi:MAG: ribosome biogenesis GTP-binding protein YihA/YsxC [Muribaculaceae bacterium]|nr:ribosome biogenesis GTP-binding protein YihA/YsxC [Muribaculaceae bacterium]